MQIENDGILEDKQKENFNRLKAEVIAVLTELDEAAAKGDLRIHLIRLWRKHLPPNASEPTTSTAKLTEAISLNYAETIPLQIRIESAVSAIKLLALEYNFEIAQEIGDHALAFNRLIEWGCESNKLWRSRNFKIREWLLFRNLHVSLGIAIRSTKCSLKYANKYFEKVNYLIEDLQQALSDIEQSSKSDRNNKKFDAIHDQTRSWLDTESKRRVASCPEANKLAIKEDVKLQLATGIVETFRNQIQAIQCQTLYARVLASTLILRAIYCTHTCLILVIKRASWIKSYGRNLREN